MPRSTKQILQYENHLQRTADKLKLRPMTVSQVATRLRVGTVTARHWCEALAGYGFRVKTAILHGSGAFGPPPITYHVTGGKLVSRADAAPTSAKGKKAKAKAKPVKGEPKAAKGKTRQRKAVVAKSKATTTKQKRKPAATRKPRAAQVQAAAPIEVIEVELPPLELTPEPEPPVSAEA